MSCKGKARAEQSFKPSPHTSQVHQTIFNQPDSTDTETHLISRLLEKNPYKALQHQENGTLQGFKDTRAGIRKRLLHQDTLGREHTQDTLALERRLSCSAHANILPALIPTRHARIWHARCRRAVGRASVSWWCMRICRAKTEKKKLVLCYWCFTFARLCSSAALLAHAHARTSHMHRPQRGVFRR